MKKKFDFKFAAKVAAFWLPRFFVVLLLVNIVNVLFHMKPRQYEEVTKEWLTWDEADAVLVEEIKPDRKYFRKTVTLWERYSPGFFVERRVLHTNTTYHSEER